MKLLNYFKVILEQPLELPNLLIRKLNKRIYILKYQKYSAPQGIEPNKIISIDSVSDEDGKIIVNEAEKILTGKFDFIGLNITDINNINWNFDYKTFFEWEQKPYWKINIYSKPKNCDIKTTWELNRLHHLIPLSLAWKTTKDDKYLKTIINHICSWKEQNSTGFGVNWLNAMEVAIRSANLAFSYSVIKDAISYGSNFHNIFSEIMYQHGVYIFSNLEWFPGKNGNHYISNLCGLIFISLSIPECKRTKKWLKFSVRELEKEINRQTLNDGANFEGSISYHRLVLEMILYTEVIMKKNGLHFTESTKLIIKSMLDYTSGYIKPNGLAPQIGDNDSGRFIILFPGHHLDHKFILELGAILYRDINVSNLMAPLEYKESRLLNKRSEVCEVNTGKSSDSFEDIGIYIMRNEKSYLLVSSGIIGQNGNGGHGHNDKLSIELQAYNKDFFVDPGTFVYTANKEWRNYFRSTFSHNTIIVNGLEQNEIPKDNVFNLNNETKAECEIWKTNDASDLFVGFHRGYEKKCGIIHKRRIEFEKIHTSWRVTDEFIRTNEKNELDENYDIYLNLVLSPEVIIGNIMKNVVELENAGVTVVLEFNSRNISIAKREQWYSVSYGNKVKTNAISVRVNDINISKLMWIIKVQN